MIFFMFFIILMNNLLTNSEDPNRTSHYVVSDPGRHCLLMSHKKKARLIWNIYYK